MRYNNHNQLGRTSPINTPGSVYYPNSTLLMHAHGIAADRWASYAITINGGNVYSWGGGGFGELGDQAGSLNSTTALYAYNLGSVRSLAAGEGFVLAMRDGELVGWGDNSYGQLGSTNPNPVKTNVGLGGSGYLTDASAGFSTTFTRLPVYNVVFALGRGTHGALGNGTTSNSGNWVVTNNSRDVVQMCGGNEGGLLLLQ